MPTESLAVNTPATEARLRGLLDRLRLRPGTAALDIGCGRGWMLLDLARRAGCAGVGVDPDAREIERARGLTPAGVDVHWHCARFDDVDLGRRFDAVICVGATHAFGDGGDALPNALDRLRGLVSPGGRALLGVGFWKTAPPAPYLEATGFDPAELRGHDANAALAEQFGWAVVHAEVASTAEWDAFEGAFLADAEKGARDAPDGAAALARRDHWRSWNEAYRRWGRDTLGFGYYVLEPRP